MAKSEEQESEDNDGLKGLSGTGGPGRDLTGKVLSLDEMLLEEPNSLIGFSNSALLLPLIWLICEALGDSDCLSTSITLRTLSSEVFGILLIVVLSDVSRLVSFSTVLRVLCASGLLLGGFSGADVLCRSDISTVLSFTSNFESLKATFCCLC